MLSYSETVRQDSGYIDGLQTNFKAAYHHLLHLCVCV